MLVSHPHEVVLAKCSTGLKWVPCTGAKIPLFWPHSVGPELLPLGLSEAQVLDKSTALQRECWFPGQGEECPRKAPPPKADTPVSSSIQSKCKPSIPKSLPKKQASGNRVLQLKSIHMNTVFIPGRVTLSSGLLTHLINCNDRCIMLVRIPLFSMFHRYLMSAYKSTEFLKYQVSVL